MVEWIYVRPKFLIYKIEQNSPESGGKKEGREILENVKNSTALISVPIAGGISSYLHQVG